MSADPAPQRSNRCRLTVEGFPHIFERIIGACDESLLLRELRAVCRFFKTAAFEAHHARSRGLLFIEMEEGDADAKVKCGRRVLPWFRPESPEGPKRASIERCASLVIDQRALRQLEGLLQHLPRACRLEINDFRLDPGHWRLPPVRCLRVFVDTGDDGDTSDGTPAPTLQHAAQCVSIDVYLGCVQPAHWWQLVPFVNQPAVRCVHVMVSGDERVPVPDPWPLDQHAPVSAWRAEEHPALGIYVMYHLYAYPFGGAPRHTREDLQLALRRVFPGVLVREDVIMQRCSIEERRTPATEGYSPSATVTEYDSSDNAREEPESEEEQEQEQEQELASEEELSSDYGGIVLHDKPLAVEALVI